MRAASSLCGILLLAALGAGDAPIRHLTRPWSELSGLTEQQRATLIQIHREARAKIQEILQQERRDCLGVLSQKQLDQLRDMEDQQMVQRKRAATQSSDAAR